MQAIILEQAGPAETVLAMRDMPSPIPGRDQVLIHVIARPVYRRSAFVNRPAANAVWSDAELRPHFPFAIFAKRLAAPWRRIQTASAHSNDVNRAVP